MYHISFNYIAQLYKADGLVDSNANRVKVPSFNIDTGLGSALEIKVSQVIENIRTSKSHLLSLSPTYMCVPIVLYKKHLLDE